MSSVLPIVERFHSLQGEGIHFGRSAFFIRLGGCTVGCPWCDTKESWQTNSHRKESISHLSEDAATAYEQGAAMLILTGGEPLHHNLNNLCEKIRDRTATKNRHSMPIHLETSGVDEVSGLINWITLSPKRHCHPKKSLLQACDELKVIIHTKEDIAFAEEMAYQSIKEKKKKFKTNQKLKKTDLKPHLFLQPGWESEEGKQLAIQYIKTHPEWRLSLQAHKWLGVL